MRDCVEQCHSRGMVRIRMWELKLNMEYSSFIESSLRSSDVSVPCENVMVERPSDNSDCWDCFVLNLMKVFDKSLVSEGLNILVNSCAKQSLIC